MNVPPYRCDYRYNALVGFLEHQASMAKGKTKKLVGPFSQAYWQGYHDAAKRAVEWTHDKRELFPEN